MLKHAFMRGLRPNLRSYVIQSNATTLEALMKAARNAEVAAAETYQSTTSDPLLSLSRPASPMRRLAILLPQGSYLAGGQRCAPG